MVIFNIDKAGCLVRETLEGKTVVEYRYGYLDKVVEVIRDGERAEFFYDGTGMLAGKRVNGEYEAWTWDGLALVARGDERYVNEGHVSGGVPVLSHSREGMRYHQTDILGTTLATYTADGKMEPVLASAFGADMGLGSLTGTHRFTGKPYDRHLGAHVFPYRNYDSSVARWRSSDPAGFPDGPNGHFYAPVPTHEIDPLGLATWKVKMTAFTENEIYIGENSSGLGYAALISSTHDVNQSADSISIMFNTYSGNYSNDDGYESITGGTFVSPKVTVSVSSKGALLFTVNGTTQNIDNGWGSASYGNWSLSSNDQSASLNVTTSHSEAPTSFEGGGISVMGTGLTFNWNGHGSQFVMSHGFTFEAIEL